MKQNKTWRLLKDGITDPFMHFAVEEAILRLTDEREDQMPTLRIRQTLPSVWIGYYQNPEDELNLDFCAANNLPVVRRLNSGGAVYQDNGTFCYSAFFKTEQFLSDYGLSDTDDLYQLFGRVIINICRKMGIRAELSPVNDITVNGRKIYGSAQLEWYSAFVHSGSILFNADKERMQMVLRPSVLKFDDKRFKNVGERVANLSEFTAKQIGIETLKSHFINEFARVLNIDLHESGLTSDEMKEAERLHHDKYLLKEWTFRRVPERTTVVSAKTRGGVLTIRCSTANNAIQALDFSGDFLVPQYGEIERLCNALKGHILKDAQKKVKEFTRIPLYLRKGIINLLKEVIKEQ